MTESIKELIDSNNLEDKKLGIILLSKTVPQEEFISICKSLFQMHGISSATWCCYSLDMKIRLYMDDSGNIVRGGYDRYTLEDLFNHHPYTEKIEIYEKDIPLDTCARNSTGITE